jgi:hypothetical protein
MLPEIEPGAGLERREDLRIQLARGELAIELHEDDLGQEEPRRAGELARQQLGDEHLGPLARAAELDDIEPEIVRLHEGRDGATLTEGQYVTSSTNRAQHEALTLPESLGLRGKDRSFIPRLARAGTRASSTSRPMSASSQWL